MNHDGEVAAILGAGHSLPEHLAKIPDFVVKFGINHHASRLIDCDYIVFNDEHGGELVKDLPGKKICRFREYADILIDAPIGVISGVIALRQAQKMGFSSILLAGFDCYQRPGYFYKDEHNRGHDLPLETHLNYWKHEKRDGVSALGGPLVTIFGRTERIMTKPKTKKVKITQNKTVKIDRNTSVNFVKGEQVMPLWKAEAAEKAGIVKK